jgi:hypothetical protein
MCAFTACNGDCQQLIGAWHDLRMRERPREIYSSMRSRRSIASSMPVLVLVVVAFVSAVIVMTLLILA